MLATNIKLLVTSDDLLYEKVRGLDGGLDGNQIVRKSDLKSGVSYLKRHKTVSVIIDLSLCEIEEGNEFLSEIKGALNTPVVGIAKKSDPDYAFKTLISGAHDYLFAEDLSFENLNKSINFASFKLMSQLKNLEYNKRIQKKNEKLQKAILGKRQQLQLSEKCYSKLVNLVPVSILILNDSFNIIFANLQFQKVFGFNPVRSYPFSIFDLFEALDDQTRFRNLFKNLNKRGCNIITELKRPKKENIWCSITVSHNLNNENKLGEYVITLEDITERRLQEKIDFEKKIVHEANKVKTQFLQSISHEIRTPLTSIDGFTDMAMFHCRDSEVFEKLKVIKSNTNQLKSLIFELLDFSKMGTGELDIEFSRFSIIDLIESSVSVVFQRAKSKKILLNIIYESLLPERVCSDKHKLKQILIALLNHAIQNSRREGSIDFKISVNDDESYRSVLSVKIISSYYKGAESVLEKIFNPFVLGNKNYKIDKTMSGFSLMAVKRLVNEIGGDIRICPLSSDEEMVYELILDLGNLNSVPFFESSYFNKNKHIDEATMLEVSDKSKPLKGLNILIAEDSPDLQSLFKFVIEQMGGNLTICSDGTEVFDLVKGKQFDLMLLDIQMPKMNGDEVVKALRANNYTGPVLALTAHAFKEEKNYCMQVGFDDFITKPFEFDHLEKMILKYAVKREEKEVIKKSTVISGLKRDEYKELLTIFYNTLKESVSLLKEALDEEDYTKIRQLTHKIKGSSSCYGYSDISQIAKDMNAEANRETPEKSHLSKQLNGLKHEFTFVEKEYEDLVS